jgi:hypothetical protein
MHVRGGINLRSFLCLLLQLSNNNLCGGISAQPLGACGRIAGFGARSTASTRCPPSPRPPMRILLKLGNQERRRIESPLWGQRQAVSVMPSCGGSARARMIQLAIAATCMFHDATPSLRDVCGDLP